MKAKFIYLIYTACIFLGLSLFSSCSEKYDYETDYSAYDGMTMNIASTENGKLPIYILNQHDVIMQLSYENLEIGKRGFIYELSDTLVAEINLDGQITPLKPGTSNLKVTFRGNQNITAECIVEITPVVITDVVVPEEALKLKEGQSDVLSKYYTVVPADASIQAMTFEVEDPSILSVDKDGKIVALKEGETRVKITTTDGSNIVKYFPVAVLGEVKVASIQLSNILTNGILLPVGQTVNIADQITVLPANADNPTVSYTVTEGNNSVLTTDSNGNLKAVGTGTATVVISSVDGTNITKEFTVTVDNSTDYYRLLWKVDTSIVYSDGNNFTPDNDKGAPVQMFDNNTATYFCITKPGKNYNGHNTPSGHQLYFYVDMGAQHEVNYFRWRHRDTQAGFKVHGVTIYGSNDNESYVEIAKDINLLAHGTAALTPDIDIPLSNYRYIKVDFVKWVQDPFSNLCVAEFWLGKK